MSSLRAGVLVAALMAGATGAHAQIQLINDETMAGANWSASILSQGGGFSFNTGNPASGGNPGAYRAISHASVTGFTSGLVGHFHTTAWDPAEGELLGLSMGVDVNCFNGGTSNAVAFGLIIEQNGTIFFGPTFTALTGSGWRTDLRRTELTAGNFVGAGSATPDFTRDGAPLRFGFYSSNGTGNAAPISSSSGTDNFFVTLNVACAADLDLSGFVDSDDFVLFVAQFARGCTGAGQGPFGADPACVKSADFDRSGFVDSDDFVAFAQAFQAPC
ncbi:MAG: hypothetical protein SFY95_10365 [Planctomycetota bacterium]|nr:hypothetical protein [Planctomycetota bacterium]